MTRRVAIVGQSFRFPSSGPDSWWDDLMAGRNLITQIDKSRFATDAFRHPDQKHPGTSYTFAAGVIDHVGEFDPSFFRISPREAALVDPQQRLLLELGWEALENAGIAPSTLRGTAGGVFVGISSNDYAYRMVEDLAAVDSPGATGNAASIAANRLSWFFDLHGPSMAIDTACSSSLVAFHQACRAIESGDVPVALAGGVNLLLHPYVFVSFSKAGMLSRQGRCRVFDASADGYVRAEGGGLVVLKDLEQALADGNPVLAVVAGSGINTDGHTQGLTVPSARAQAALMAKVYQTAGVSADALEYLEAHGTGTPVGDPVETLAISQALARHRSSSRPLPIGSVKSNIGHLEAASGIAGLVKVLHCLKHRVVPATIGIQNLNPNIPIHDWNLDIVQQNRPLRAEGPLLMGVNSFGFGGANAHVVLQSFEPPKPPRVALPAQRLPVVVSATDAEGLRENALRLAAHLESKPVSNWPDVAHTLNFRRDWLSARLLTEGSAQEVAAALRAFAGNRTVGNHLAFGQALPAPASLAFVYSGNGSQWEGMARRLLTDSAVFRAAVLEVDDLFRPIAGFSLLDELLGLPGPGRYAATEFAQPALFAMQVGLTRLLELQGVRPNAVTGHSIGEIAAAWAAGALSLEDAVHVVHHRSRLQGTTRGAGGMTAVKLSAPQLEGLLNDFDAGSQLAIAARNSPDSSTIAGPVVELERFEARLKEAGHVWRRLDLDYAFHSPAMDSIEDAVRASLANLRPRATRVPFHSTVTGRLLSGEQLDASYWWRNIREPVAFGAAVEELLAHSTQIFIEIGPHPVLTGYLRRASQDRGLQTRLLHTQSRKDDSPGTVWQAGAQAILAGAVPDWSAAFPRPRPAAQLPSYVWQRRACWHGRTPYAMGLLDRSKTHPWLGYPQGTDANSWECPMDTALLPILADHRVQGAIVFPAAGFAELCLAAIAGWQSGPTLTLSDLDIRAPLLIARETATRVHTRLDKREGMVIIEGPRQAEVGEALLHAKAWAPAESVELPACSPLVLPRRPADFDSAAHYQQARARALDYGPSFQRVKEGWREGKRIIAILREDGPGDDAFHLAPTLMDAAFQLISQWPEASGDHAFVPVRIGRLVCHRRAAVPVAAEVEILSATARTLSARCVLYSREGNPLAILDAIELRRIPSLADRRPAQQLTWELQSAPLDNAPGTVSTDLFERVQSGAEELFRHLVRDGEGSQYVSEFEPLLDSLCRFLTRQTLEHFADENGRVEPAPIQKSLNQVWFTKLLFSALADGTIEQHAGQWQLVSLDEPVSDAIAAIQGSLLAEHPDQAELILAVTRTGERLPALLRGELDWARMHPKDLGLASLMERARGTTTSARLGQGLAHLLAADSLSRTEPRLLEITAGDPLILSHASPLHLARAPRHILASATPKVLMGARARWPSVPTEDLNGDPAQAPAVDCVLVMEDANSLDESFSFLRHAKSRLRADGVLMLMGHFPARWLDFVMGARGAWFGDETRWRDRQQPPSFWRRQLDALGFESITLLALDPDLAAGPWLLIAKLPGAEAPVALSQPPTTFVVEPPLKIRTWQLLAWDANPLVTVVERELRNQGHTVRIHVGEGCPALDGVDAVIDFPADAQSTPDLSDNPTSTAIRCARIAALVRALDCDSPPMQCWLVTRNAWGFDGLAMDDAAVWGFARTVANETERADFHLVDLAGSPCPENPARHLLMALASPDAERECIFTASGDALVPRLRAALPPEKPEARASETRTSLVLGHPGSLDQLHWATDALPPLEDDEVEVHVAASALNFRDLMLALGLLPPESVAQGFAGPTLGLEFSGTVTRVGRRELVYRPGDRVLGYGAACFSNRVRTRRWALAPVPPTLSFEAAATIPTAFVTAWYALHHVARLRPGERVLIHGAAGGVGLAALQVARLLGAEVYATVGSEEKRDFLRLMGIVRIYDSRSLIFADGILADTAGEGVDVVLNSLSGDALSRSLDVLRAFGRFIELGKRDFHENTRLGLRPFRNNVSYHGVDVDQLMRIQPDLARTLLDEVIQRFRSGDFQPLPYRTFNAEQVVEAFRHMQGARHIGKIVVNYPHGVPAGVNAIPPAPMVLDARGAYLVTGGLSGFGLRAAGWLVARGARHLVLLSRSATVRDEEQGVLALWRSQGCRVDTVACDITDTSGLKRTLDDIAASGTRLRGVLHAAAVYDDGVARNLDLGRIRSVLAPKIRGAQNLVSLTREMPPDFIVFFSSATTLFGNPGQAAYVAANHWLESFARAGRVAGLPITCMSLGPIADAGYLARNADVRISLADRLGGRMLLADEALRMLERALMSDTPVTAALDFSWPVLSRSLSSAARDRFSDIATPEQSLQPGGADGADFRERLEGLVGEALHNGVLDLLREALGAVLGLSATEVDVKAPIHSLGLDSLMAVELSVAIERGFGVRVPEMGLGDRSLDWLSERVIRLMSPETADSENEVDEHRAAEIQFLARHAESMSASDLFPHANSGRSA